MSMSIDRLRIENWSFIRVNLTRALETHILVRFISSCKHVPWMTPQLKRLIRKKQRFYNNAKRTKLSSDWAKYKSIQGQVYKSIHAEHQNHITKILISSNNLNLSGIT